MTVQNNASMKNLSSMTGLSEAELQKRAESLIDVKTGKIAVLSALDAALVDSALAGTANMASFTAAGSATIDVHTIDSPADAFVNGNKSDDGYAKEPPPPPQIGGPTAQLEKAGRAGGKKMSGFCGSHAPPPPQPAAPPPPFSPEGGGANNAAPSRDITAPPSVDAPATTAAPQAPSRPSVTGTAAAQSANAKGKLRTGFGLDGAGPNPGGAAGGTPANTSGPSSADMSSAGSQLEANSTNMQFELLKMQMQKLQQATDAISNVVSAMNEEGMTAIRNAKA